MGSARRSLNTGANVQAAISVAEDEVSDLTSALSDPNYKDTLNSAIQQSSNTALAAMSVSDVSAPSAAQEATSTVAPTTTTTTTTTTASPATTGDPVNSGAAYVSLVLAMVL